MHADNYLPYITQFSSSCLVVWHELAPERFRGITKTTRCLMYLECISSHSTTLCLHLIESESPRCPVGSVEMLQALLLVDTEVT
jgi:hypothetical protein